MSTVVCGGTSKPWLVLIYLINVCTNGCCSKPQTNPMNRVSFSVPHNMFLVIFKGILDYGWLESLVCLPQDRHDFYTYVQL